MSHTCHYPHCPEPTPPRHLFCITHWAMVPPSLQTAVYAAFRATKTREERLRSRAYLTACAEAVEAVAAKLGVVGAENNTYRRLLKLQADRGALIESGHSQGVDS